MNPAEERRGRNFARGFARLHLHTLLVQWGPIMRTTDECSPLLWGQFWAGLMFILSMKLPVSFFKIPYKASSLA